MRLVGVEQGNGEEGKGRGKGGKGEGGGEREEWKMEKCRMAPFIVDDTK